jgi:hypothetical protein
MDLETLRNRVKAGYYLVKSHAIQHALKEGFEHKHIIEAILNGKIIEEYPAEQRMLISGTITLAKNLTIYLHVVCEYADSVYVEIVTAYLPDETQWEFPPFRRRQTKRK